MRFQRSGQRSVLEGRAKAGNVISYNIIVVAGPGQPGSALLIVDAPNAQSVFVNADSQGMLPIGVPATAAPSCCAPP